jgi:hypothetical protein
MRDSSYKQIKNKQEKLRSIELAKLGSQTSYIQILGKVLWNTAKPIISWLEGIFITTVTGPELNSSGPAIFTVYAQLLLSLGNNRPRRRYSGGFATKSKQNE